MNSRLLTAALLMCVGSQAVAREIPKAGRKDNRMRTVVYDPSQVVRLSAAIGRTLVVTFSKDEKVTAVAVSDSRDLVAIPRENFLFMKSKLALPPQPIVVLTSGPKGLRRYVFEVEARPPEMAGKDQPVGYYSVEFLYPEDLAAATAKAEAKRLAAEQELAAKRELARADEDMKSRANDPMSGARNWHYVGRGSNALMPVEVFDNGYSTVFRFPGNMRIPAIFRINPDGREATVNYAVKGDYVVVGAVAAGWRLRDGDAALCVWNRAYDKVGNSTETNTTSANVKRITKDAPR